MILGCPQYGAEHQLVASSYGSQRKADTAAISVSRAAGQDREVHRLLAAAKREIGRRARAHAEALLDPGQFVESCAALIERVAVRRRLGPGDGEGFIAGGPQQGRSHPGINSRRNRSTGKHRTLFRSRASSPRYRRSGDDSG